MSHYYLAQVQSDYAEHTSLRMRKGVVIMTGDALSTVDPTTGLGVNQAIRQAKVIKQAMEPISPERLDEFLDKYDRYCRATIEHLHSKAIELGKFCRPDTLPAIS